MMAFWKGQLVSVELLSSGGRSLARINSMTLPHNDAVIVSVSELEFV